MKRPLLWVTVILLASACASPAAPATATPAGETRVRVTAAATPADRWAELLAREPFPYSTPLPPAESTPADGTYVKLQPFEGEHVHCLRCPDYLPERGLWKMQLDRGVFRIFYAETGWRSIASYAVSGDRLTLFNDPNCTGEPGTYRWQRAGRTLILEPVDDPCSIELRAANLSSVPWQSCRPPNNEAAATGHWPVPEGCE